MMIQSSTIHAMVYKTVSHPHFSNVMKITGAILVFVTCYWYFTNFDKIMGTPEGEKQIIREQEEMRDEVLKELAGEGYWLVNKIPDLPPIPYDPSKDLKSVTPGKAPSAITQGQSKNLPRIEKGKSGDFVEGLLLVNSLWVELGETPQINGLLSNNSTHFLDDARVDILFMDGKNKILQRRSINPLVVSGGLFGDKIKPLFPGETRAIALDASQTPPGWINQLQAEVIYYQLVP